MEFRRSWEITSD